MFCVKKEKLIKALEIMRTEKCDYGGGDGCDCKYGYDGNKKYSGENNGCPELGNVIKLLECISEEEYEEILSRGRNIILSF